MTNRCESSSCDGTRSKKSISLAGLYIFFLMLPIYWLINMSLKTNQRSWRASRCFRQI
jgi:ABC-type glycerol-3-phosphate transport system permease component